jgi:hypothetical protein
MVFEFARGDEGREESSRDARTPIGVCEQQLNVEFGRPMA